MTASGESMPTQQAYIELERWYRRLLWAYPVSYRRAHGQEILTTLMDSAEPGQRRPNRADVADLLRGALRQWFRLPTGKSAVIAAVLTAMTLGVVGAASASWLAWQTTANLPSETAALQTAETVAGAPLNTSDIVLMDHNTQTTWPGVRIHEASRPVPNWEVEAAQTRLQADGWTLGPGRTRSLDPQGLDGGPYQTFQATRSGLLLTVQASPSSAADVSGTQLQTVINPAQPEWELGAVLLGWIVGAGTGWILTGRTMYQLRRRSLPRRLAAYALGLTALGLAALATAGIGLTALVYFTVLSTDTNIVMPFYRLIEIEQFGGALAIGLAVLLLAATGRKRTTVQPPATAA
ncbi:hypothetical protein [Salinispora pacifica]|uniref:hypothetical protein n=1 Tax=Salinispora pacifica TaxID=351187 RepID=UPI000477BD6D|nr:hypothetical protein [Salinispora pacifica]